MLYKCLPEMALALSVMFVCYVRPIELLSLQGYDYIPGAHHGGKAKQRGSLILAPEERRQPTKKGGVRRNRGAGKSVALRGGGVEKPLGRWGHQTKSKHVDFQWGAADSELSRGVCGPGLPKGRVSVPTQALRCIERSGRGIQDGAGGEGSGAVAQRFKCSEVRQAREFAALPCKIAGCNCQVRDSGVEDGGACSSGGTVLVPLAVGRRELVEDGSGRGRGKGRKRKDAGAALVLKDAKEATRVRVPGKATKVKPSAEEKLLVKAAVAKARARLRATFLEQTTAATKKSQSALARARRPPKQAAKAKVRARARAAMKAAR